MKNVCFSNSFSILLAVCTAVKPIWLQDTVDACTNGGTGLLYSFCLYIAGCIGIVVFEMLRQFFMTKYQADKAAFLKKKYVDRIARMPMKKFREETEQNYLTILSQEIDMLVESYFVERLEFLYSILVLVTSIAALFYINGKLAVLILLFTFLPVLASSLQGKRMQRRTGLYVQSLEHLNMMIRNFISGYYTVKVNHAENRMRDAVEKSNRETAAAKLAEGKTRVGINLSISGLAYLGEIALVGAGIWMIAAGEMQLGALVAALQLSEMLAIPSNSIAYQLNDMNSVRDIRKKILHEKNGSGTEASAKKTCGKIRSIELRNVSFSYGEKEIFWDVNVTFEAGKKYLIRGENGSGKSTLFKLMSRIEDGYEGEILINGTELRELDDSYFDRIGILLQTPYLMNATLLDNLTFYEPDGKKQEAEAVMKELGMGRFLETHSLTEAYRDTQENISGGERQKLSLARVLLRKQDFILMDEATSAVDAKSSREIEEWMLRDKGMTVINIEHKLIPELMGCYDQILEVKDGRITVL